MKIAVVTCYKHNDYVRARALRTAVSSAPDTQMVLVRNRHTNLLRFIEGPLRICKARIFDRPDAYVITFRGYEMLLFMRLTLVRKPIIFDELINFTEWMTEHGRIPSTGFRYRLFRGWNRWMVKTCRTILADTDAHAEKSAKLNKLSIDTYQVIAVNTDESLFAPLPATEDRKEFTVLYYGSMLPLHGVEYVLEAAKRLRREPGIRFHFIGGKRGSGIARACQAAADSGARVTHESWVPFEELPAVIHRSSLILGGPFGNTQQSQFVVTGKTYQALACGAPVLVGSNRVHEGFTDKVNCLVVPQADAAALAEAITWAYHHPKELARVGQAGRTLYESRFSQEHTNRIVRKLIKELRGTN